MGELLNYQYISKDTKSPPKSPLVTRSRLDIKYLFQLVPALVIKNIWKYIQKIFRKTFAWKKVKIFQWLTGIILQIWNREKFWLFSVILKRSDSLLEYVKQLLSELEKRRIWTVLGEHSSHISLSPTSPSKMIPD